MCIKTPPHSRIVSALVDLNDQLQFYFFMNQEMRQKIDGFNPELGSQFNPKLFSENPFAPSINVSLDQLRDFQFENVEFTSAAYFATSYEVGSGYYNLIHGLLSEINSNSYIRSNGNIPELVLYQSLDMSGYPLPDYELIETLSYIRLRRNHFIHLRSTLTPSFSDIINDRGNALNAYWQAKNPPQDRLDFSSEEIQRFEYDEVIQLLGLIRIVLDELDHHIASVLNHDEVILYLFRQRFGVNSTRMNQNVAQQRAKTIRALAILEFGLQRSAKEIETIIYKK